VSVSYDSEANRTTYETRGYTAASSSAEDFASAKSISVRAIARCVGTECTPNTARLVFRVNGDQKYYLTGVSGNIEADGTKIEWSDAEANADFANLSRDRSVEVRGKFATVDLSFSQVQKIATASSVEGEIGGQSLDLSPGLQNGLQRLLKKSNASSGGSAPQADR
jgi:hypothetical protein